MDDIECKSLTTNELYLTDEQGNVRAKLFTAQRSGSPVLQLNDSEGRPRIDVQLDLNGNPYFTMFSANNVLVFSIGADDKRTGITMWSPNGNGNLNCGVRSDGNVELSGGSGE